MIKASDKRKKGFEMDAPRFSGKMNYLRAATVRERVLWSLVTRSLTVAARILPGKRSPSEVWCFSIVWWIKIVKMVGE